MKAPPFEKDRSWRQRVRSFGFAARGLGLLVATQWNARFHVLATIAVFAGGWRCHVSALEWCALLLSIALVFAAEALNTAIETVVDLVSPEFNLLAQRAKDLAAGGVLAASLGAATVGAVIFAPRVISLFSEK